MARGLILSPPATASFTTRLPPSPPKRRNLAFMMPSLLLLRRLYSVCKCSLSLDSLDMAAKYKEVFSDRMSMAGLKPHHRIALGVSGGPDSMALCFLTAAWKTYGGNAVGKSGGFIEGLLAIIVDHGLRVESKEEAQVVSRRVSQMGIRCEIAHCHWSDGKPKQGHLQEEAREKRYQIFQTVCARQQIDVLLIGHHADDQAELFILRLSRNSGVLGLAGMAFTSRMFTSNAHLFDEGARNEGILVVRPLLDLSKEDMYKICRGGGLDWVEDPTNRSQLYARNRIRMSLENLSSYKFRSELLAVISTCRKTRAYVDHVCNDLISQAVTIIDEHGYAVIDLEILNPSKVIDICLSKFVAMVLQFISQRQRPVRGSTLKLMLDYIRAVPCKTSLTASGCYLCPAPGSRGTKVLVCCSVNCPLPSKMKLMYMHSDDQQKQHISSDLHQIIADGNLFADRFVPDNSDAHFLEVSSESILAEAQRLHIISEPTYQDILLLQRDEIKHFKPKNEEKVDYAPRNEIESPRSGSSKQLQPGQSCFFMNRFLVTWKLSNVVHDKAFYEPTSGRGILRHNCFACTVDHDMVADVRHMIESDWLYLAKLSKCLSPDDLEQQTGHTAGRMEQTTEERNRDLEYLRVSAQKALLLLKSIPIAARRGLPVLVNRRGLLLSAPSIHFNSCPCLEVSCVFKPRVPLGGGHCSFL